MEIYPFNQYKKRLALPPWLADDDRDVPDPDVDLQHYADHRLRNRGAHGGIRHGEVCSQFCLKDPGHDFEDYGSRSNI